MSRPDERDAGAVYGERGEGEPQVVVRDRRRIDPESGAVRPGEAPAAPGPAGPGGADPERVAALEVALAERTGDLQRLKAEYDNYRRRVDRDRAFAAEQGAARVLTELLPTLDDIDRARAHGDLTGGFAAVAESLERALAGVGLERYGAAGDEFDPNVHEALTHGYSDTVSTTTCVDVFRAGYRHGDRVLRPAQVAVADPEPREQGDPGPSGDGER